MKGYLSNGSNYFQKKKYLGEVIFKKPSIHPIDLFCEISEHVFPADYFRSLSLITKTLP